MTEVSSWSPTDASNNLTPPDGWPEGMQPSGVNDVGRMMMGSIRRWYNTVSAGIANCLPLSGGTLTGDLTAPGLHSTGNITATNDISGRNLFLTGSLSTPLDISARNIVGALLSAGSGPISGGTVTATGTVSGANVNASGGIAASTIVAGTQLTSNGALNVAGSADVVGTLAIHNDLSVAGSETVGNLLTVSGMINTNAYQLGGVTFATHGSDAAGVVHSICDPGGQPAIDMYGTNGTYYRCGNAHSFTNRGATLNIARFQATDGNCQNATGSWSVFSDASVKENLTSYTAGLAEVLQLNPQSFSYTPGKTKFATEGRTFYGLVAQEVEPILPEMVSADDETGIATLAPTHLVYVLINAVKELEARLAQVENRGG